MHNKSSNAAIAKLESQIDLLESELIYLNKILTRVGFPEGIKTLKETVHEVLIEDQEIIQAEKNFRK